MPNLSIKNVPEALAERLRQRAALNHRSLQGELMAIIEQAGEAVAETPAVQPMVAEPGAQAYGSAAERKTIAQIAAEHAARAPMALDNPRATDTARANRDGRRDDLLATLDSIVAGSRWGNAPMLTRDQANDRSLIREIDHLVAEGQRADHR